MGYEQVQTNHGNFAVDWEIVRKIFHSYQLSEAQLRHCKEVRQSQKTWNPFSWMMPDLVSVEVNWPKVREEAHFLTELDMFKMKQWFHEHPVKYVGELREKQDKTRINKGKFQGKVKAAQIQTSKQIKEAVSDYDKAIFTAEMTRDVSAGILIVGSSVMTAGQAGAAIGWLAAGSGLKATAKAQNMLKEKHKFKTEQIVGAATMEFVGNMVFGMIPIGAKGAGAVMKTSEEVCVVFLEAGWETAIGMTEGKTLSQAATGASVKFVEPFVGKALDSRFAKDQLDRWAIPLAGKTILRREADAEIVQKFTTKTTEMVGKMGVGKAHGAAVKAVFPGKKAGSGKGGRSSAAAQGTLTHDERLLQFAIIDMQKGVPAGLLFGGAGN